MRADAEDPGYKAYDRVVEACNQYLSRYMYDGVDIVDVVRAAAAELVRLEHEGNIQSLDWSAEIDRLTAEVERLRELNAVAAASLRVSEKMRQRLRSLLDQVRDWEVRASRKGMDTRSLGNFLAEIDAPAPAVVSGALAVCDYLGEDEDSELRVFARSLGQTDAPAPAADAGRQNNLPEQTLSEAEILAHNEGQPTEPAAEQDDPPVPLSWAVAHRREDEARGMEMLWAWCITQAPDVGAWIAAHRAGKDEVKL